MNDDPRISAEKDASGNIHSVTIEWMDIIKKSRWQFGMNNMFGNPADNHFFSPTDQIGSITLFADGSMKGLSRIWKNVRSARITETHFHDVVEIKLEPESQWIAGSRRQWLCLVLIRRDGVPVFIGCSNRSRGELQPVLVAIEDVFSRMREIVPARQEPGTRTAKLNDIFGP